MDDMVISTAIEILFGLLAYAYHESELLSRFRMIIVILFLAYIVTKYNIYICMNVCMNIYIYIYIYIYTHMYVM